MYRSYSLQDPEQSKQDLDLNTTNCALVRPLKPYTKILTLLSSH